MDSSSEDVADYVDEIEEDETDRAEEIIEEDTIIQETAEEVVGDGNIQVGEGVTAAFDANTGAVEFYSNGGTLWSDWIQQSGIDKTLIKSIKVSSGKVYLPKNSSCIFSINFYDESIWKYTSNLKTIDLSGFDTSNVMDMSSMFSGCSGLTTLDLSSFNTSNVKNLSYMFRNCSGLTSLNLNSFDTSNVEKMQYMFENCSSLNSLKIENFNTSNVKDMSSMFRGCSNLQSLDVSRFNTSNVTDMNNMFADCSKLKTLAVSQFDTSNVTSIDAMFFKCSGLTSLDVSHFNTSKVTSMDSMFYNCTGLTMLDVSNFNTSNVQRMNGLFCGCSGLTTLDVSNFDTANVTDMSNMFQGCSGLTELDLHTFNTTSLTDMYMMFSQCTGLKTLDISSFNTKNVTNMYSTFNDCRNLTRLDLHNFDVSNVYNMDYMFYDCSGLEYLNLSSFDLTNVRYCTSLLMNSYGRSSSLQVLLTPKANTHAESLPVTMCDESGNVYNKLPLLSKSITLRRKQATVTPTPAPTVSAFSDVSPSHPYFSAINWAAKAGITGGYKDGTFGINKPCTRGHAVMFLWKMAKKPEPRAVEKSPFPDVPKSHSFYKAVLWAQQQGITKGYTTGANKGKFGLNDTCTRGQIMSFIWRFKDMPDPKKVSKSPFKDVPTTHAYYKAILWGSQNGVTKGYTTGSNAGKFGINDNCTRGQIVKFLYNIR